MSKFWANDDSSSESNSESDSTSSSSGSDSESDASTGNKKAGDTTNANRWVMDSDSSDDDEVRVVKSAKDKAWEVR